MTPAAKTITALLLGLFALIPPAMAHTAPTAEEPDFAFPREVIKDSDTALSEALKAGDSRAMLRALIDLSLAGTMIDGDSLQAVTQRVDSIRLREKEPLTRALLDALLARIYMDIYLSDAYTLDRRPATLGPLPEELSQWSGSQFRSRIMELCEQAMQGAQAFREVPVAQWTDVVSVTTPVLTFFRPSMLDFLASEVANIYKSLASLGDTSARLRLNALLEMMTAESGEAAESPAEKIQWEMRLINAGDKDAEARLDALIALCRSSLASNPASFLPLDDLNISPADTRAKEVYGLAKEYVSRWPGTLLTPSARNIITMLEEQSVAAEAPNVVYPGDDLCITLTGTNIPGASVTLWKVPADYALDANWIIGKSGKSGLTKVKTVTVDFPQQQVPFTANAPAHITIDNPGRYVISASAAFSPEDSREYLHFITCTRLAASVVRGQNVHVYALDARTGAPVKGAQAHMLTRYKKLKDSTLGKTDAMGAYTFGKSPDTSADFYVRKDNDRSTLLSYWPQRRQNLDEKYPAIKIFTSLPLYHPGDTLRWNAICYEACGYSRSLLAGKSVEATVYDANGSRVAPALTLKADDWGRLRGECVLPSEGLTGSFRVTLRMDGRTYSEPFQVSDYKLPTFEVTLRSPAPQEDGAYIIEGNALTYTGLPVAGAKVSLSVSSRQRTWWWRMRAAQSFFTAETLTGSDGTFTLTVPAAGLDAAPWPQGIFAADVTVVSATAESESASTAFTRGPAILIGANIPSVVDAASPVKMDVRVTDLNDKPLDIPVEWTLFPAGMTGDDAPAASGTFTPGKPLDWSAIASGSYRLKLTAPGAHGAEPYESTLMLYRPDQGSPSPSAAAVWTPANTLEIAPDGTLAFLYGTPSGESNVLLTVLDRATGKTVLCKWLVSSGGMASFSAKLPDNVVHAEAVLLALRDFRPVTLSIEATKPSPRDEIVIRTSSIRDVTEPLAEETWTVRVEYADGAPAGSALIADIYTKAMDRLASSSWDFSPRNGNIASLSTITRAPGSVNYSLTATSPDFLDTEPLEQPQWQFWGLSFSRYGNVRRNIRYRMNMSRSEDCDGLAVGMMKAPMMASAPAPGGIENDAMNDLAAGADAMMNEEAAMATADATDAAAETPQAPRVNYRPSEIPLALYRPTLTTDADGALTMTFTMPNAITTWQVELLAFTRELVTARYSRSVVASKPLMVQPNLPRFVRAGDRVEIATAVFNKTDSLLQATVTAEAIDAASGSVMARVSTPVEVQPAASATVTLPVTVTLPAGALMQWRVSGVSGTHTDGEQAYIPVLTSSASLIESYPFYLPTDAPSASLRLPALPNDAHATLQYCGNPLWLAVMALPTLSNPTATCTTECAGNLLISLAAKNIVTRYPAIADAIAHWSRSDRSAETLTSMLSRNPELKQLLLEATPWVREARSDTERMERLALLLRDDNVDRAIAASLKQLRKLQNADGGFPWMASFPESSLWVTTRVLTLMGSLSRMGWLPADKQFTSMLTSAISYMDRCTVNLRHRYPKDSYLDYAMLRTLYPDVPRSTEVQALMSEVTERVMKDWKKYDPVLKARAAVLLAHEGHPEEAARLLASLSQFAITSPECGMTWDDVTIYGQSVILDAYVELRAPEREIDLIRQWLIRSKEAQDWGNSPVASLVVANIITSSSSWVEVAAKPVITLGGAPLSLPSGDYASGFLTMPLPAASASGATLTVERQGSAPSWGAVIARYVKPATAVKAASVKGLAIEKELLLRTDTPQGVKWLPVGADTRIPAGATLKVRLTLKAGRTMDYVAIVDERAAALEPVDQLPGGIIADGLWFYRENSDASTRIFIDHLVKGTYVLTYDVTANNAGVFTGGVATVQSQMTPALTAHSAGTLLNISPEK